MKKIICLVCGLCYMSLAALPVKAQIFSDDSWDQKTLIMAKWSPLFYELNVGANVNSDNYSADFLYFSIGYNKPSTSNEWNKFIDKPQSDNSQGQQPSQPSAPSGPPSSGSGNEPTQPSQPTAPTAPSGSMDGLHAGMINVGWQHFFNHVIGFHIQAGWGFVADFGSNDDKQPSQSDNSTTSNQQKDEKKTFIYNSAPIQVGVDLNLWENLVIQAGATYMWKEKPYLTVGLGITF